MVLLSGVGGFFVQRILMRKGDVTDISCRISVAGYMVYLSVYVYMSHGQNKRRPI